MDPFTAAAFALQAGTTAASFLQKPKRVEVPDVSAIMARIQALYAEYAKNAAANIQQMGAENLKASAADMASKGIYRAPVSAAIGQREREATQRAVATSNAQIGAQSAGAQSQMLGQLLEAQQGAGRYNAALDLARQQDIYKGLGSIGTSLLSYGMQRPDTSAASKGPYYGMQSRQYSPWEIPGYQIPPGQLMTSNLIPATLDPSRQRFGQLYNTRLP